MVANTNRNQNYLLHIVAEIVNLIAAANEVCENKQDVNLA